jgi:signal transduction histidine kinase
MRGMRLGRALLASLATCAAALPAYAQTRAALPLLTDISAIRALSQDEAARGYPVRIRGTVTHFDELQGNGLIIYDGEFGQFVEPPRREDGPIWKTIRSGDVLEIDGYTIRGGFAPNVQPDALRRIGHRDLPPPKSVPYLALLSGRHDCDYVEIEGVVQRAWASSSPNNHAMFAEVAFEDGVVRASFWKYYVDDLDRFVDARVRLRGNVGAIFGPTEQLRGVSLFAGRTADIQVLAPPPNPFALPIRPVRSISNYPARREINRRVHVRGVVTAAVPGHPVEAKDFSTGFIFVYMRNALYVKDSTGGVRIETEQAVDAKPGDVIEAAGFPAVTPGRPTLRNAVFRTVGSGREPAPVAIGADSALSADYDAELVRLDAQVLGALATPTERVVMMKTTTGDNAFAAGLDRGRDADRLDDLRPGTVVRVTGVYSYQSGPPPTFRLFLRSQGDIAVVRDAPWWTLRHTIVMLVMLAFTSVAVWIWVKSFATRKRREYQAVLTERNRVARELHDTLEQGLTGIALQLEAVAGTIQSSPDMAQRSLDVARQMLRYSLEETRRSVMDLRSQALEARDLAGALAGLARQMTMGTTTIVDVKVEGQPRSLDAAQEHHLLRIGLEALTNSLKHAAATRVTITLGFRPDETILVAEDNGRGLPSVPDDVREMSQSHFGLLGIRERVTKIGGVLDIRSSAGEGTRLEVRVPLCAAERSLVFSPDAVGGSAVVTNG